MTDLVMMDSPGNGIRSESALEEAPVSEAVSSASKARPKPKKAGPPQYKFSVFLKVATALLCRSPLVDRS